MKVEVDLTEYGVKTPKWYDPINPHIINASGGSGPESSGIKLRRLHPDGLLKLNVSYTSHINE